MFGFHKPAVKKGTLLIKLIVTKGGCLFSIEVKVLLENCAKKAEKLIQIPCGGSCVLLVSLTFILLIPILASSLIQDHSKEAVVMKVR